MNVDHMLGNKYYVAMSSSDLGPYLNIVEIVEIKHMTTYNNPCVKFKCIKIRDAWHENIKEFYATYSKHGQPTPPQKFIHLGPFYKQSEIDRRFIQVP